MSMSLEEALKQVSLEPGRSYRLQIEGKWVEVKVDSSRNDAPAIPETDIMLEPWVELPGLQGGVCTISRVGKLPPPDPPIIPLDHEEA